MVIGYGDTGIGIAKAMRGKASRCHACAIDILALRAAAGNYNVTRRRTGDANFVLAHRDIMD